MNAKFKRVRTWSFRLAPHRLREHFPEGRDGDWLMYVPNVFTEQTAPFLLRWRELYPVSSVELTGATVYWGAPREIVAALKAKSGQKRAVRSYLGKERRSGERIPIEYRVSYRTNSSPRQSGVGYTIDMSNSGIAFTTESLLPIDTIASVRVSWPVLLEGGQSVELLAVGTLARTEERKAALKFDTLNVTTVPQGH